MTEDHKCPECNRKLDTDRNRLAFDAAYYVCSGCGKKWVYATGSPGQELMDTLQGRPPKLEPADEPSPPPDPTKREQLRPTWIKRNKDHE